MEGQYYVEILSPLSLVEEDNIDMAYQRFI